MHNTIRIGRQFYLKVIVPLVQLIFSTYEFIAIKVAILDAAIFQLE
jgi:hypothetical protein